MFGRNVDFFAVCFIALVLTAFSNTPLFRLPLGPADPIRLQNAVSVESSRIQRDLDSSVECLQKEIDARIAHLLDQ